MVREGKRGARGVQREKAPGLEQRGAQPRLHEELRPVVREGVVEGEPAEGGREPEPEELMPLRLVPVHPRDHPSERGLRGRLEHCEVLHLHPLHYQVAPPVGKVAEALRTRGVCASEAEGLEALPLPFEHLRCAHVPVDLDEERAVLAGDFVVAVRLPWETHLLGPLHAACPQVPQRAVDRQVPDGPSLRVGPTGGGRCHGPSLRGPGRAKRGDAVWRAGRRGDGCARHCEAGGG
mmetsp:Transcript_36141/g.84517  ORF Transcript_36141/g.84517 Transcript_36141/m.84517 type:complete len:235 (+) Transcript_36141:186-890(+)